MFYSLEAIMTLIDAIKTRRSIRSYKPVEVTQEQIEALLEAAMLAPSANNGRPWRFVVVKSKDTLKALAAIHPYAQMLLQASCAIVVCGKPDPTDYMSQFFPQDCGAATQNLLLRAVDLGLGACWCGVYPNESLMAKIQELLHMDDLPFNIIAVGVPNEAPAPRGSYDPKKVSYR
jgi:nitroreductase